MDRWIIKDVWGYRHLGLALYQGVQIGVDSWAWPYPWCAFDKSLLICLKGTPWDSRIAQTWTWNGLGVPNLEVSHSASIPWYSHHFPSGFCTPSLQPGTMCASDLRQFENSILRKLLWPALAGGVLSAMGSRGAKWDAFSQRTEDILASCMIMCVYSTWYIHRRTYYMYVYIYKYTHIGYIIYTRTITHVYMPGGGLAMQADHPESAGNSEICMGLHLQAQWLRGIA